MKKVLLFIFVISGLVAQEYIGNKKCKSCHKKESSGAQYLKWQETKHANAFETLKTPAARETATKLGITTNPWETPKCVKCHTTGFGNGGYEIKDKAFWEQVTESGKPTKEVKRMAALQHVGCEACHGPGENYKSKKTMTAIFHGDISKESVGMLTPTRETCIQCHNEESPSFHGFDFDEFFPKISHPYPDGYRESKAKKDK